jgi:SRSO17 transposase
VQRDTVRQELDRAKYYDDKGGWVGWTNRKEADRRARESYENVIRSSSAQSITWQAHNNLGKMFYDEGNFKQSIIHWKNAQLLSESSWQQTSLKENIGWANCRLAGGTALKCMGLE